MSVKKVQYVFQGQTYDLVLNGSTGKYEATITAPQKSSFSQPDNKYGGSIIATDDAGNSTTVNETHSTLGDNLKIRVLEKVAPVLAIAYPTAGSFITNPTPEISWNVTDSDSGVNPDTIKITIDGTAITSGITKTAITNGYSCKYTPQTALANGSHTVAVNASDNDGNAATAKSVSFTVDTVAPILNVTSPTDGYITNNTKITVSGKTDDATSKPVTVTVNGTSVTVNTDGTFSKEITLVSGSNTIMVVAKDKAGKTTTITRRVTLDTGAPVIESITITPNPVDAGKTFIISVEVTD